MNLVGLALRNLKRRPIRTCLSILGIGLAVGSALALIALSRSIQDSTREGMDEIGDDLVVMQKGSSDIFGGFIPEETVDRIAALPGVGRAGHVCPERLRQKRAHARMARRELPVEEGPPAREPRAGRGRAPRRGARRHRGGLLGQEARRRSGADRPDLPCRRHRRLHHDRQSRAGAGAVDRPAGSELPPRQVTILHVNVEHASGRAELGSVRVAIEALGKVTASTANEVLNNDRNFAILEAVSLAVSIIAVAMSALNVLTALVMATQERTREIGIFAAIGWSNARIMMSIVIEGILMCVSGCVLGVLLSLLATFAFPRIPAIGNLISFKPSVALIAPVVVAAFVLCVLGALLPAWRAVRMVPAEALRRL
jgi:putative ABC transport system permease protein